MDPTPAWYSGFSVAVAEISGCAICRAGVSHLDGLPRVTKRGELLQEPEEFSDCLIPSDLRSA